MPEIVAVPPQQLLEHILTLEIVRVTERAAVSAARLRGHGNKIAADQAAVDAMRRELNKMPIDGTIVIGEGERDKAPMLFIGEKVGNSNGPKVDVAVDPLDGTTLCAKGMPGAIATMAMAEGGTLLNAPDVYMQKIAIGPGYAKGVWSWKRRRRTIFVVWPRRKPFRLRRSRHWSWIVRGIRHYRCGAQRRSRRAPDQRWRRRRRHPHRGSGK
jgi:Bacterial fructose-1,6-bisphosphatase, glpX-encoded